MISARSIIRKVACTIFLVQLSGCCCCDGALFEALGEGFEEGLGQEMERQAKAVQRQAEEAKRQAKEAQSQGREAKKRLEEAHEAIADAVVKGDFVDDSVSGHEFEATVKFEIRDRPKKITAVVKGKHHGKKFSSELEGEINEITGIFKANSVKGDELTIEGVGRDGRVQGAITGKIDGRDVGAPFHATPAKK